MSIESRGQNPGVIEHDQVIWPNQLGEIAEAAVLKLTVVPGKLQHTRHFPLRKWLLRNKLFWKPVIEFRNQHCEIIGTEFNDYTSRHKNRLFRLKQCVNICGLQGRAWEASINSDARSSKWARRCMSAALSRRATAIYQSAWMMTACW